MHLGTAFQLMDDVLDYSGDLQETGKNLGDDLAEGKPTLPLIHVMREGSEAERKLVRHAVEHGGKADLEAVVAAIHRVGRARLRPRARAGRGGGRHGEAARAFRPPRAAKVCYNWRTFPSSGSSESGGFLGGAFGAPLSSGCSLAW